MKVSQETMDRIFKEVMDEYEKIKKAEEGKKTTFDSLEGWKRQITHTPAQLS